jgi:hypothetical protein
VPMGSETCPKNSGEWCSLTFRPKKTCLRPNLRVLQASWRKLGVFSRFAHSSRAFWVIVGPKRTPNDKVMTVFVNTGPFYGSPWKNFFFTVTLFASPPRNFVSSIVEILFPHIYWPMPGMPFHSWLSHT